MELDFFTAADKRFYEPLDRRPPATGDFKDRVERMVGEDWVFARKGVWLHCHRRGYELPVQGWKIHLSTIPAEAADLLETAAALLIPRGVSFKFLADLRTLRMTSAKTWSRGASGKFITVYPADEAQFRLLLDVLDTPTRRFHGPFILSDRRYKDNRVLYYRYGGIKLKSRLRNDGSATPVLVAPDGREVDDVRHPFYVLPDWVQEPFPGVPEPGAGASLRDGRYRIEKALHFSNSGGVYAAIDDRTGARVVLKEARAHVHTFSDELDAAALLRHEFEVLKRIEDCGAAPRPIELFQEWEHLFLVEERLEGYLPLRRFSALDALFLETRPTREKVLKNLERDLGILEKVAAIIERLHERGVVWGDVSFNNILVHPETHDVRIIDLESARLEDGAALPRIITAGFSDVRRTGARAATVADDYFGFGSVMLFLLTHANSLLELKPDAGREFLDEMCRDFGIPRELGRVVEDLLDADPAARPTPRAAVARARTLLGALGEVRFVTEDQGSAVPPDRLDEAVRAAADFIKANADPSRSDRLYPADPLVYQRNPLNLAHGAAGVLLALAGAGNAVDPAHVDWLLRADETARLCPPGLYQGQAGIAWALLELGRADAAEALMTRAADHPLLRVEPGLYEGYAGWGLANLKFWRVTGRRAYLRAAEEAGRRLVADASRDENGLFWPGRDGLVTYGLGAGASGIALFLLYLDRALGGAAFEASAADALAYDASRGLPTAAGGLSWHRDSESRRIVYPYLRSGSAGVGVAAARFLKATGQARYRELIEKIHIDCDRKYTVFPGRDEGLAGLGEFHLDAYQTTGDPRFRNGAFRAAAGLRLFEIVGPQGTGYPGNGLARMSCDLATGSAGVLLFLDRLRRPRPALLLLDEVLG